MAGNQQTWESDVSFVVTNGTLTQVGRKAKIFLAVTVVVAALVSAAMAGRNAIQRRDPDYTDWEEANAIFQKPLEDLNATRLTSAEEACGGLSYCVEYKKTIVCNTTLGNRISATGLDAVLVELDCDTGDETDTTGRGTDRHRLP